MGEAHGRKREVRAGRAVSKFGEDYTESGGGRILRRRGAFFWLEKYFSHVR
jgi:hypothetical protein